MKAFVLASLWPAMILSAGESSPWKIDPQPALAQIAKLIQGYAKAKVLIEGHTDSKGPDSYNAKLSDRRDVSVKNWLANMV